MKRIFSLTIAVLTAVSFIHATEPAQPIDPKLHLASQLTSCDAAAFETSWKSYQETAAAQELAITQAQLTTLATQLKAEKELARTKKRGDIKWRIIAGINGTLLALVTSSMISNFIPTIIYIIKGQKIYFFSPTKESQKRMSDKLFNANTIECDVRRVPVWWPTILPILCSAVAGKYALQALNYVCFAGTEQLTQEIAALDRIIALLTPEQSSIKN